MYPKEYMYTSEHEWVLIEDDICTMGITEFAQSELGDVVFVDLPEVGQVFDAGDELGTIESVKAVAEIYSPVAGEIVEVNTAIADEPEVLNDDPHHEGWLVKLRIPADVDLTGLMDVAAYKELIENSGH